jgi:long-chain fatty acid transport protein
MSFLDSNKQMIESGLTLAHLPENKFRGSQAFSSTEIYSANGNSEVENIILPYFHYISNPNGKFRWGASLTVPGGLTKRWKSDYQKLFAQEFTLKILEFNPVLSYRVNDNFSIGGGLRAIYSEGKVYSDGNSVDKPIKREMEGNTLEYGYNLATTYRPTKDISLAVTYRSNVDLKEDGDANLYIGGVGKQYSADVTVPLPASLDFAISKTWLDKFTLEFNYERTYWSKYKSLDFNYGSTIQAPLIEPFDNPKAKNWKDTDTFRVGATIELGDITYMVAYAKDESPIPKKYINYELPDSDGDIFSLGAKVKVNDKLSWGIAYLHDEKEDITLKAGENKNGIIGKFSGGGADLLTVGIGYEF